MSETTARTLAEIVAEGRMLEETVQLAIDLRMPTFADELISRRNEFRAEHWPALLAVAEAADKREAPLAAAAREALAVLTRLADSAAYWSDYDVPVGIVAEIDAAKARLAGVLRG